jgi:hypothetical protein
MAVKKAIILSDDDDEVNDITPVISRKKSHIHGHYSKSRLQSSSSDYEDESAEDTASNSDCTSAETSLSDVEPKRKSNAKSKKTPAKSKKPVRKSSKKELATSTQGSDDSMDVDELSKSKATTKKRKADEDGKQPSKKQKRREESDPWKLESSGVKRDWTQMQAPPLEMFHFSRIVVDEYTYLDGKTHSMVTRQTGDRRWVLSGTVSKTHTSPVFHDSMDLLIQPPIHDFGALKTISAYLDIHLGIDDEAEGRSAQVRKRTREQTGESLNIGSPVANLLLFVSG